MQIDDKTIHKITHLARLEYDAAKSPQMIHDLTQILNWVEQLNEVDTNQVEPLFSIHLDEMPQRLDKVSDGLYAESILSNAPEKDLNMFAVPKVVE